jgi:hypothetical protein
MTNQQKLVTLWIVLIIGMLLHQTFHLSKIFYGINVARPGANGIIPDMVMYKRVAFYILPLVYISFLLFIQAKWIRIVHLPVSIIYLGVNIFNFLGEFEKPKLDLTQVSLLGYIAIASMLLVFTSYKWMKSN